MSTEPKRTRTPSDPIATTVAPLKRMSPDQLDAVGGAVRTEAPKSARILVDALSGSGSVP